MMEFFDVKGMYDYVEYGYVVYWLYKEGDIVVKVIILMNFFVDLFLFDLDDVSDDECEFDIEEYCN